MPRAQTLAAVAMVGVLSDGLPSEVGVTWLTVAQRDGRRSRSAAASAGVSGDGRYVAFSSYARLNVADDDSLADVYVLDRATATVTLESGSVDGRPLNSDCGQPGISADGRYVVFATVVTVADDPGRSLTDIVLRDRLENTTRRITTARGGGLTNGWSSQPVLTANANAVVFASAATNLVSEPDVNGEQPDIYRFDVNSQAIERISVDSGGVQHRGTSVMPSVSGDGRLVAFTSTAVLGQPHNRPEQKPTDVRYPLVYLRETRTGRTTMVGDGEPPNGGTTMPAISADGRTVAFASRATNLVARDRNKSSDVFMYNVDTGEVTLVSRGTGGGAANGNSLNPAISADGRFVAFQSDASDMACGRNCRPGMEDINLLPDVFVFDRATGQISCISLDRQGTWLEESGAPAIDASGGVVAFTSRHPISPGDVLNDFDLFVRITSAAGAESRGR
jgi:Tol biopolymer transport system component